MKKNEALSEEIIRRELKNEYKDCEIAIYKCLESTNSQAKQFALDGEKDKLLVLSEEQTAGRGRKGRSFYSPAGTGIYMSFLFRPTREQSKNVVLVTTAASVAVCRAIRKVTKQKPTIKWVNDIYLRDKKICGILTEAISGTKSNGIDAVIVGIGLNIKEPEDGFSEEIKEIAGTICKQGENISRNALVSAIINELFFVYERLSEKEYMDDYRKWSNVLGKCVTYTEGTEWKQGIAVAIDEDGGLIIQRQDGSRQVLRTGEITVRVSE